MDGASDPGPVRRAAQSAWPLACIVVLWLLFFWRILTPNAADRLTFQQGDFTQQFLAYRQLAYRQFAQGIFPVIEECLYSGHPFLADPQSQILYPPVLALMVLGRLSGWPAYPLRALEWEVLLHVLWAGIGVYAFLRAACSARRPAALFGAAAFMFGGFINGYAPLQTGILETAAWAPWLLWALHRLATRASWFRHACVVALVVAAAYLAGHPQTLLLSLYAGAAAFLYWAFAADGNRLARRALIARAGVAGALALGFAAPQLLPSLQFAQVSTRAAVTFSEASNGFQLSDIWMVAMGDNFSLWQPLYVGLAALAMAVIAVALDFRRVRIWVAIGAAALVLSFGANAAGFDLAFLLAPGYAQFRSQERHAMLASLMLAVLAGCGMDALLGALAADTRATLRRAALRVLAWSVPAFALMVAVRVYGAAGLGNTYPLANRLALLVMGMLGCGGLLVWRAQSERPHAAWAGLACGLLLFDLFTVTRGMDTQPYAEPFPASPLLQTIPDKSARIYNQNALDLNVACVNGFREIGGGSPIVLKTYDTFLRRASEDVVSALLDVRHTVSWRTDMNTSNGRSIPYEQISQDDPGKASRRVYALRWAPAPGGEAWIAPVVGLARSEDDVYTRLNDPAFLPFHEAVIYDQPVATALSAAPAGRYNTAVEGTSSGYMKIAAFTEAPALLIVSRAYYPNWVALVNGAEVKPVVADGALIGVPLAAGNSTIELSYRPLDLWIGLGIAAITGLVALGGLVVAATRERRRSVAPSP